MIFFLLFFINSAFATETLSELRVFNRSMLIMKEHYVDPERLNPEKMLIGALDALEKEVPELIIGAPLNNNIRIQMGADYQNFSIKDVTAIWNVSLKLSDIFRFIEPRLKGHKDLEYAAVNGTLSQLDPHSVLLEPKFSKEMKLSTKGEFGGLGIVIGLREGLLTVISPLDGTPAYKAGIKALDQITKIDDTPTLNLALDEAVDKLRGKPGTRVVVTIQRQREIKPRVIPVIRAIIKVDSITAQLLDHDIGYIKIKSFHGNTSKDLKNAMGNFKNMRGLILDFRNNPGGLLNESVAVSDLFLDGGVIVVTEGAQGKQMDEERASPGIEKTQFPIVVLVNSGSASASEIVAGALKNRDRALVVGEQTFGKGSVQMLYDLPDQSALKLTIAQYLTPGDQSIQSVGIMPDILLLPAYADSKKNLELFPQKRTREADLESHLNNKKSQAGLKPAYQLNYVSKRPTQDQLEKHAVSSAFQEDFEIRFAKRLLTETQGNDRKALLATSEHLLPKIESEENTQLTTALKKFGIDWSIPISAPSSQKAQVSVRVIGKPVATAGKNLKISIEATNWGKETLYQFHGISKSDVPFLNDLEFIFGKLAPQQKRIWETTLELPKNMPTQHNSMQVSFQTTQGSKVIELKVPVQIIGLDRPTLAYEYKVDPIKLAHKTRIHFTVRNIGPGIALEPLALLKSRGDSTMFIEQGRQKLKPLKRGESAQFDFVFTQNSKDSTPLQFQLYDAVSGEFWTETLTLNSVSSIFKTPPKISWLSPTRMPIIAKNSYRVQASIEGRPELKDAYLFVNDQKVAYQAQKQKLLFNYSAKLKPGLNQITLVARAGDTYAQRETLMVYSEP